MLFLSVKVALLFTNAPKMSITVIVIVFQYIYHFLWEWNILKIGHDPSITLSVPYLL